MHTHILKKKNQSHHHYHQLLLFLNQNNNLFSTSPSAETALLKVANSLLQAADGGNCSILILLRIQLIVMVDHNLLIGRL